MATHCDAIALVSLCVKINGIQQWICKFATNIFQNGPRMLRTMTMTMNMFLLPCNAYMKDTTHHIHKNSSLLLSFGT